MTHACINIGEEDFRMWSKAITRMGQRGGEWDGYGWRHQVKSSGSSKLCERKKGCCFTQVVNLFMHGLYTKLVCQIANERARQRLQPESVTSRYRCAMLIASFIDECRIWKENIFPFTFAPLSFTHSNSIYTSYWINSFLCWCVWIEKATPMLCRYRQRCSRYHHRPSLRDIKSLHRLTSSLMFVQVCKLPSYSSPINVPFIHMTIG